MGHLAVAYIVDSRAAPLKSSHPWTNLASGLPNAKKVMALQDPGIRAVLLHPMRLELDGGGRDVGCFRARRPLMSLRPKENMCMPRSKEA